MLERPYAQEKLDKQAAFYDLFVLFVGFLFLFFLDSFFVLLIFFVLVWLVCFVVLFFERETQREHEFGWIER